MKCALLLSLAFLCLAVQADSPMWQQLFRFDCDGTVEVLGSTPMGAAIRAPALRNIYNTALDVLYGRVQCVCPTATRADFEKHFNPVVAGLNGLSSNKAAANQCIQTNFPRNLYELDVLKISLPSTCTYTSYTTSGTCGLQYAFSRIDMTLQLGLFSCPNTWAPGVSLTCSGTGCSNMLKPCSSSADCGAPLTCFDAEAAIGSPNFPDIFFKGLATIKVYDNSTETTPGCFQAARGAGAKTTSNDIFTNLFTFMASEGFGLTSTFSNLKVCGILEAANFTSSHFSLADTALGDATINTQLLSGYPASCLANVSTSTNSSSKFYGMDATHRVQVDIPGLNSWNGIDSSSVNVFTRADFIPAPTSPQSSNMLLLQLTCDQNLLLPSHNAGLIIAKKFTDTLQHLTGLLQQITNCRTTPPTTSVDTFLARFGVWNLKFWFRLFDPSSVSFTLPSGVDFRSMFTSSQVTLHGLPSSCNWNTLTQNGLCQIDFTGLKTLILADVTFRFTAQTCSTNNQFLSYSIECIGADCPFFTGLRACDSTSQCTPGFQCQPLAGLLEATGAVNATEVNKGLSTDFINLILNSAYNSNLCSAPSWINSLSSLIGNSPQNTCDGPSNWQSDINKMILGVAGSSTQPASVTSKLQYCLPSATLFSGNTASTWAQSLIEVSGSDVTLKTGFQAVTATTPSPSSNDPHATSGVSLLAPSSFVFMVLALIVSCLIF